MATVKKYDMVMNLAHAMLAGCGLEAFFSEWRAQTSKPKHARQRSKQSKICSIFMIAQFLNWQFVLLTSKVDGEMPLRGSAKRFFHGETQPRKVQSKTARSKQVFG
jgi:hypothetical protein